MQKLKVVWVSGRRYPIICLPKTCDRITTSPDPRTQSLGTWTLGARVCRLLCSQGSAWLLPPTPQTHNNRSPNPKLKTLTFQPRTLYPSRKALNFKPSAFYALNPELFPIRPKRRCQQPLGYLSPHTTLPQNKRASPKRSF